jgi:mycothiol synthase
VELPPDLTARSLTLADAPAVTAVIAAQEIVDLGEALIEEADIVADWQRPSFDLSASTVGVFDGDRLVGYAEISGSGRGDAAVDPVFRGRGLGRALAAWMQETARRAGDTTIGMPVPVGSAGEKLLRSLGYQTRWTSWVLALPEGRTVEAQPLPEGYAIRAARSDDHAAAWTVAEDAFLEWSKRDRQPFEDWAAGVVRRPGFEPWMLRVAVDPAGVVVGISHVVVAEGCAYVAKLAVRADVRRRGIARALLADSFAAAEAHGAHRSELSTDSRTGALDLYVKLGMEVTSTWVNLGLDLS